MNIVRDIGGMRMKEISKTGVDLDPHIGDYKGIERSHRERSDVQIRS